MIELDETPVPPSESATSSGNASEEATTVQEYTHEPTRSTLGFLADEERSGFAADEESFGFSMRPTANVVSETGANPSVPDIPPSSIDTLPRPQFSFDDTAEAEHSTEAETFAGESAKREEILSQEKLPTTVEASSMQAVKAVVQESAPEKPLSEAQQLADMLASAAVGTSSGQATSSQAASNEESSEENMANSHTEAKGSIPKVITISSETEIAKEQQRLLRKQELLDYQHRKKEQFKAAEQAEKRSSGRAIAAVVMTTLIGAATTAGFFAWRNPALRTATEEAWQKLTGKAGTQANTVQTAGNADSMLSAANTASGTGVASQEASQEASPTTANTVTPLDLTQAASGTDNSKTVAAQDVSQNAVDDSARPSATTPANTSSQPVAPSQVSSSQTSSSARTNATDSAKRQHLIAQTAVAQTPVVQKTASVQPSPANNKSALAESKKTSGKAVPPPTTGPSPEAKANVAGKAVPNNVVKMDAKQKVVPTPPQQGSATTAKNDTEAKSTQKKPTLSKPSSVEKLSAPYLNNGVFAIQVYASPSQADAEDWVERLRRRGFLNPSMSSQVVRGQVVYRVRFGLYNTLRDAERDAERYGFAGAWVVRLR